MQLCNGIGNNEVDDHKTLSIVWGESLLVYGKHVRFNQPLLKLSNCAIHLQQCKQLLRMSCKKKKSIIYIHCNRYYIIYLSIYSIHAKISKVDPYTDAFNIKTQYCMHSVKHTTKKIIL